VVPEHKMAIISIAAIATVILFQSFMDTISLNNGASVLSSAK
jgi:hypothetical protein